MKKLPGIFNDVIGPVMRGPSSSHTAASWRIARTALNILNDQLEKALVEFDRDGAWAPNYRKQGTTMGVDGGLLGFEITDERIKDVESYARQKGIAIDYQVNSFPTTHANTVRLTLWGILQKKVQLIAISIGGGSFRIQSINGFEVEMNGELYEILFFTKGKPDISDELKKRIPFGVKFLSAQKEDVIKYEYKSSQPFSPEFIAKLKNLARVDDIPVIEPVMPIIAGRQTEMPFTTIESSIDYAEKTSADLGDLGLIYEKCLSGMSDNELNRYY